MDSLSEESKLLYDMIMSETDEIYEAKFASYRARALAAAATATSKTRSTTTIGAPSGTASREYCHEQASATSSPTSAQAISTIRSTAASACAAASTRVPAAASLDSSPALVLSRPTATAPTTPAVSHFVLSLERVSTENDLTSGARRIYNYLVGNSDYLEGESSAPVPDTSYFFPELEAVHGAVDITNSGLATVMPTNCSSECPSDDAYASLSWIISSATANSTRTTCSVIRELATPADRNKALDMDVMGDTASMPAICLNDSTNEEEHVEVSLTLWSASRSFNPPGRLCAPLDVLELFICLPNTGCSGRSIDTSPRLLSEAHKVFHDSCSATAFVPWPPPNYTHSKSPLINEQNLFHNVQLRHGKEFIAVWVMRSTLSPPDVQNNQGQWSAICPGAREDGHQSEKISVVKLNPPWPTSLCMCMSLPRRNAVIGFHSRALEVIWLRSVVQLSGYWQVLETVKLQRNASIIVIPVALVVQCAQLQPALLKWTDQICIDTHSLMGSTSVDRLRKLLCWSSPSTTVDIPDWVMFNRAPVTWVSVSCQSARVQFQWALVVQGYSSSGVVQKYTISRGFLAILSGEAIIHQHYSCTRVPTVPTRKIWIDMLHTHKITWRRDVRNQVHVLNLPMDSSEHDNQLTCKTREQCLIGGILLYILISKEGGIFGSLAKYINEEKQLVNICASATQAISWTEIQPTRQVWTVLLSDQNGDSVEQSFDQVMEIFTCPTITCELHYSTLVIEILLAAPYSFWCMRCVNHDIEETQEFVLFLQPKPPWSLLEPNISTGEFRSSLITISECMHVTILYLPLNSTKRVVWSDLAPTISSSEFRSNPRTVPKSLRIINKSFELSLLGVPAWYMLHARFRPLEAHFPLVSMKRDNDKDMSFWDYLLQSANHVQLSSHCFRSMVQYPYGIMDTLLIVMVSAYHPSKLIQGLHHPLGKIIDGFQEAWLGCYITVGCFRTARNNEFSQGHAADGFGAMFRLWDPGDYSAFSWRQSNPARVDDTCYCPGTDTSQIPWDPGGSSRDRLEGKPNVKEGGLSTTICSSTGLDEWAISFGPGLLSRHTTNTMGHAHRRGGLERNGWPRPVRRG